jgi:hypothetical protein
MACWDDADAHGDVAREGKAWYSMCVSQATYSSTVENVVQKTHHPMATGHSRANANANGDLHTDPTVPKVIINDLTNFNARY